MQPDEKLDYYEILEVSRRASPETIKAAYRALCKKYHPDTYAGNPAQAEAMIKRLNEAYRVLGDAGRRAAYDSTLRRQPPAPAPSASIKPASGQRKERWEARDTRLFLLAFGAAFLVLLALMLLLLALLL